MFEDQNDVQPPQDYWPEADAEDFAAPAPIELDGVEVAVAPPPAPASPAEAAEHPALTTAREAQRQRLAEQDRAEAEQKAATQQKAAEYLQAFYEKRASAKEARIQEGREALAASGGRDAELGPVGDTPWERTVSLLNFNASKSDLGRFKSVLLVLKAKGGPVPAQTA